MENIFNKDNIIQGELRNLLDKYSKKNEIAVVFSYDLNNVRGCYSTKEPKIPTIKPRINFNGIDFLAEQIADLMIKEDSSKLDELSPFRLYASSKPNEQDLEFRLLIAGNINDKQEKNIVNALESEWKKEAGTSTNLQRKYLAF